MDHKVYQSNIWKMYLFSVLISFNAYVPIYIIYLSDYRHLSMTTISFLEGIGWIATALSEIPTGAISDKYGRRISLLIGAFLYAPICIAYGIIGYFPVLLTLHILWNMTYGFFSGSDSAIMYDSLKMLKQEHRFDKVVGRQLGFVSLSTAIGGLIGAWVATYHISFPFILGGIFIFIAGITAWLIKEPVVVKPGFSSQNKTMLANTKEAYDLTIKNNLIKSIIFYRSLLNVPPWLCTFLFVTPYLQNTNIKMLWLGPLFLLIKAAAVLGSFLSYKLSKFIGHNFMMYGIPFLLGIEILLLACVSPKIGVILILFISLTWAISKPYYLIILNNEIPSYQRATILSFQSLTNTLCLAICIPVFGTLLDQGGFVLTLVILLLLVLSISVLLKYTPQQSVLNTLQVDEKKYF